MVSNAWKEGGILMNLMVWREKNGEMIILQPKDVYRSDEFQLAIVSSRGIDGIDEGTIIIKEDEDGYLTVQVKNIDIILGEES